MNLTVKKVSKFLQKVNRSNVAGYEKYLDGLRGLAIALVFATHANLLTSIGYLGVDVFFVVSGFVISKQLVVTATAQSLPRFFVKRISRLAPAMLLVVGLAVICKISNVPILSISYKEVLAAMFWMKNFSHWGSGLDFLWTVSAEMQVYLVFALVQFFMRFQNRFFRTCVWLGLFCFANFLMIYTHIQISAQTFNQDGFINLVIGRPSAFFLGAALTLYPQIKHSLIFRILAFTTIPLVLFIPTPTTAALFTAGLIILSQNFKVVSNNLQRGGLVNLGVLSYSVYLWHIPTMEIVRSVISHKFAQLFVSIFTVLIISMVSYIYFELPARTRLQRVFLKPKVNR